MSTTWKIEITEPHSGELGEAILHEDHGFAMEEYTYEAGHRIEVAVHENARSALAHLHRPRLRPSLQDSAGKIPQAVGPAAGWDLIWSSLQNLVAELVRVWLNDAAPAKVLRLRLPGIRPRVGLT